MVPFAVAVLVNSVFINVQANIAAEAHHYQEVFQKPAHKAMPKKNLLFERVGNIAGKERNDCYKHCSFSTISSIVF